MLFTIGMIMFILGWYAGRKQATKLLDSMSYRIARLQALIDQELAKIEDIKKIL